jgi:sortase B
MILEQLKKLSTKINKKYLYYSICVITAIVFLTVLFYLLYLGWAYRNAEQVNAQIRDLYNNTVEVQAQQVEAPPPTQETILQQQVEQSNEQVSETQKERNLDVLAKINNEVFAWINIPDTQVDYPVLKGEDNAFYLDHSFYKNSSKAGSIFIDYRCDTTDLSGNTILYGHNMNNGTMFSDLMKYSSQKYADKNKYIYMNISSKTYKWQVFSAYTTDTSFNYLVTDFETEEAFKDYTSKIIEKSSISLSIALEYQDKLLTLSTCTNSRDDTRMVVHAKLVEAK